MRIFIFFILCLTVLTFPALGQSTVSQNYFPESASSREQWNPYPGLGNVGTVAQVCVPNQNGYPAPSSTSGSVYGSVSNSIPTTTLYAQEYSQDQFEAPWTSTKQGGEELYLSRMPTGKRSGAFQRLNFNALWVPNTGGDKGLGMTHLDLSAAFAFPFLTKESPLIITPSFQSWFFDPNQDGYSMSDNMYTTGVDVRWMKPIIKDKLTLDIGVATLYSGDFHAKGSDALRFPAHAAGIWNCNPRLKLIFGVLYLDRKDDYNWLPMVGLIWTPHDDLSVELVMPRFRIAQRVKWWGSAAGDDKSDWIYTAFELGGGSWAYERDGYKGNLDYRDMRALIGCERRCASGVTIGFEVGYMFERKFELDRTGAQASPGNSVFLRLRTAF